MTGLLSRRDALLQTVGLAAAGMVSAVPVSGRAAPSLKPARGEGIDRALQAGVSAREIPGVVAMAANEQSVLYEGAFGLRNMAGTARMSADTIFRIASMVKLLTSGAALQLVEQGKLRLDEPAANIDPTLASIEVLAGFDAKGEPQSGRKAGYAAQSVVAYVRVQLSALGSEGRSLSQGRSRQ
jgi:CubicO group peptidase (beta-lactamase class C family)